MVYFIRVDNLVKIGTTKTPISRFERMTDNPFEYEHLLLIDGFYEMESELHNMFHRFRVRGEWFNLSDPIRDFIKNNMVNDRRYEFGLVPQDDFDRSQIRAIRLMEGLTLDGLGEMIGVTKQGVSHLQGREILGKVSIRIMNKIADALGYEFQYRFIKKNK